MSTQKNESNNAFKLIVGVIKLRASEAGVVISDSEIADKIKITNEEYTTFMNGKEPSREVLNLLLTSFSMYANFTVEEIVVENSHYADESDI